MEKYIVYKDHRFKYDAEVIKVEERYADFYRKKKMSFFHLVLGIIFERGFRWKLEETIKYALIHHEEYRGENASDVMLLTCTETFEKLFKQRN